MFILNPGACCLPERKHCYQGHLDKVMLFLDKTSVQFNKNSRVTAQHAALSMLAMGTPTTGGGSSLLHWEMLGAAEGWVLTALRIAL